MQSVLFSLAHVHICKQCVAHLHTMRSIPGIILRVLLYIYLHQQSRVIYGTMFVLQHLVYLME